MNKRKLLIGSILGFIILFGLACAVPAVNQAILVRVDEVRLRLIYMINPPESQVFTPGEDQKVSEMVNATLTSQAVERPTITATPTVSSTVTLAPNLPTFTPQPPTATPTPLPASALIPNVPYVDQNYGQNNCAPANLSMALEFWGWQGKREDVSKVVKPFERDKNVMPYELVDYVNTQTQYRALNRLGGTLNLLKTLVAAGYPVIVERGVYLRDLSGRDSWMGHYQVVYGYDDSFKTFQVKDSFETNGDKFSESYDDLIKGWRSFDYAFVMVYPADRETELFQLLGQYSNENSAARIAYDTASQDINVTKNQDLFFSWYNRGTSQVALQDFSGAAQSFDQAYAVYAKIPIDYSVRPWRITWYETGPYFAYYYSGRYTDVINLANTTLSAASEPFLEESYYWRAMAEVAVGKHDDAVKDLQTSLQYHPDFSPSLAEMQQLGVTP